MKPSLCATRRWVPNLVLGALLVAPAAAAEGPAPRTLTLAEAIDAAVAHAPAVRAAEAGIETADATRSANRNRFFPIVRVEGNVMVWDSPTEVSFTGGGDVPQLPPPATVYEAVVEGLVGGLSAETRIREQVTADLTLSVVQPLTPFLILPATWELLDLAVDGARLGRDLAERQATVDAITGYVRVLQADALERSARQGIAELDNQLSLVDSLLASGVARESDRMRLQVARAGAEQDAITSATRARLARAALATAMGLPTSIDLQPAPLDAATCAPEPGDVETLQRRALSQRAELARLAAGIGQVEQGVDITRNKMLPNLNLVLSYMHVEGQALASKDSGFAGLFLEWNWDWLATYHEWQAASSRVDEARAQRGALEDGLRLQVEQAHGELHAAVRAQEVARLAESLAAETVRLEAARYEAGDATATEVVTAEGALRQARDRRIASHHQCLVARVAVRAAAGDPLTPALFSSAGASP